MYYENIEREKAAQRPVEASVARPGSLWRREPDEIRPRFMHVSYTLTPIAKRTPTPFAYDFIEAEKGASSAFYVTCAAAFSTALKVVL